MNINGDAHTQELRLNYRADIQGLRAIAILLVIAAHAKVPGLAGGFIGVDIFFVLSGYLITGLLTHEIVTTGSVQFMRFYARRFRRLLPAMLFTLALTCIAATIIILPSEQVSQASAAAAASVWLSNFYFAFSNIDYFGASAENNLFLHTWSLGVEEQFYLVWPALLVLIAMLSLGGKLPYIARLKAVMVVVVGISLFSCIAMTPHAPELSFYMMPWRAWQFGLGALVLLHFGSPAPANVTTQPAKPWLARFTWVGPLGLGLIFGSALLISPNLAYPGAWALIPSIGTALLLAAGTQNIRGRATAFLSLRPMQAIGRVSYSWYLWHWPVLILGATLFDSNDSLIRFSLVAVSLLLAALSYRFIESPVRQSKKLIARPGVVVFISIALIVAASALSIRWGNGLSNWLSQPEQKKYASIRTDAPSIYGFGCDDWYRSSKVQFCAFGKENAKHTAVIMGDSIGLQWFPAVATIFDDLGWKLLIVTKSACPMVDAPLFYPRIGREYTECAQWREQALIEIQKIKPDILLLGSAPTPLLSVTQWKEGTERVLAKVSASTKRIYILRATPKLSFNGPDCLLGRNWWPRQLLGPSLCQSNAINPKSDEIFEALKLASQSFPNVTMLDLNQSVCPDNQCAAERDDLVVFRDNQHLSASFVESLVPEFKQQLDLDNLVPQKHVPN